MRIFKLAKKLKQMQKVEEKKSAIETNRWKAGAGPVDPNEKSTGSMQVMTPVEEASPLVTADGRISPRSPFRKMTSFLYNKKTKKDGTNKQDERLIDSNKKRSKAQQPSYLVPLTGPPSQSMSPQAARSDQMQFRPRTALTQQESLDNKPFRRLLRVDTMRREDETQPRMFISSFRRDLHDGGSGESEDEDISGSSTVRSTSRRVSRKSMHQSGEGEIAGLEADSSPSPRRRRPPFMRLSISEQGTAGLASYRQRMMASAFDPVTPGISEDSNFFSRRKAVPVDEPRASPTDLANVRPLAFPSNFTAGHAAHPSWGSSQSPLSAPIGPRRDKNRGYFGESSASAWASEELETMTEEPEQQQDPMYQVRRDADYIYGTQFDHTAEALAAVRDVADHLPSSPMCPQNWPKHKKGYGSCPMHKKAGQQRVGELAL